MQPFGNLAGLEPVRKGDRFDYSDESTYQKPQRITAPSVVERICINDTCAQRSRRVTVTVTTVLKVVVSESLESREH